MVERRIVSFRSACGNDFGLFFFFWLIDLRRPFLLWVIPFLRQQVGGGIRTNTSKPYTCTHFSLSVLDCECDVTSYFNFPH